MKNLLKLEEFGIFAMSILLLYKTDLSLTWWWWIILFLAPDIGMTGYLLGNKAGAVTYNLFHHRGIASAVLIAGVLMQDKYWLVAGLLLFAHSSFDRVLGFGLKYPDKFQHTHLDVYSPNTSNL